jgi:hypothetical protein
MAADRRDEEDTDPRAEHGGDKGVTHPPDKGVQAEKGDLRREDHGHHGQTRKNANQRSRSGSDSNDNG